MVSPVVDPNWPVAQFVHTDDAITEYCPAGHVTHTLDGSLSEEQDAQRGRTTSQGTRAEQLGTILPQLAHVAHLYFPG